MAIGLRGLGGIGKKLGWAMLVVIQALGCGAIDPAAGAHESPTVTCAPSAGATGSPSSIAEVVTLANALFAAQPRELTLPCLLESLDRPLAILPVYSLFSVQLAVGRRSPRVFLFSANLVMSIAAEGSGGDLLELAEYTAPTRSIKAEVPFPLNAPLLLAQPYDRVREGTGTSCGGCHAPEVQAAQVTATRGFESDVLRPRLQDEVSLPFLEAEASACDPQTEPHRCSMLTAVFGHGEVYVQRFSAAARTIYDN